MEKTTLRKVLLGVTLGQETMAQTWQVTLWKHLGTIGKAKRGFGVVLTDIPLTPTQRGTSVGNLAIVFRNLFFLLIRVRKKKNFTWVKQLCE